MANQVARKWMWGARAILATIPLGLLFIMWAIPVHPRRHHHWWPFGRIYNVLDCILFALIYALALVSAIAIVVLATWVIYALFTLASGDRPDSLSTWFDNW